MNFNELGVDYLLVNTTNQFLLEYAPIEENSCHNLTGFTGDTGDALYCANEKIYLFVDGRYHTQADLEVDKDKVSVVKLKLGEKQDEAICERILPNSTLGIVSSKVSQKRYEYFKTLLKVLNVKIKLLDIDIFEKPYKKTSANAEIISPNYTGKTFTDTVKKLEKPVLFTNSEEISYICNLRDFSKNYAVKIDGKLLITENDTILFTDSNISHEENLDFKVNKLEEFNNIIKNITSPILVDKATITAKDYSLIKKPIYKESPIKLFKSVKTKQELEHMKYCFEMTDKALTSTRNYIYENENLSEYDIEKELESNFKKYGAKSLSFKSIVARNQNSAQAHYMNSSKKEILKDGDLILIDCGAYYEGGLATDITRVFVKGDPLPIQKKVYTTVLKMFLFAFNHKVKEGTTTGFEIDNDTRGFLEEHKIDNFVFSHGLGHGIGVCVHEAPPNLSKNDIAKTPIKNNMCFTIEPGLYNDKAFGVRLENTCYLENGVIKSFSNMCYEKKLIDFSMLTDIEKSQLNNFKVL